MNKRNFKSTMVRIDKTVLDRLRSASRESSITSIVSRAVSDYLDRLDAMTSPERLNHEAFMRRVASILAELEGAG